jgi:carbonic anhydrase
VPTQSHDAFRSMTRGVARFRGEVFPQHRALYHRLASHGQKPKALMISCADSRVIPEMITQCGPGELFVCRNAGNVVPPFAEMNGGVSSAIEYAVLALGVHDIIVCGHSDCGAMKAILQPRTLATMPNVAAWLRHSRAAEDVVARTWPVDASIEDRQHALAMENVVTQIQHLRTHPSVAAGLATGTLTLHGWLFEIEHGRVLAYDGDTGHFVTLDNDAPPVAVAPRTVRRRHGLAAPATTAPARVSGAAGVVPAPHHAAE